MVAESAAVHNGNATDHGGSAALRVASSGLRSMRDLANFSVAHSLDVLRNRVGNREANTSLRAISETRKLIVDGQRVGYEKEVLDSTATSQREADLAEERELTARLEALRERRSA